jgi:hypothetical protein
MRSPILGKPKVLPDFAHDAGELESNIAVHSNVNVMAEHAVGLLMAVTQEAEGTEGASDAGSDMQMTEPLPHSEDDFSTL